MQSPGGHLLDFAPGRCSGAISKAPESWGYCSGIGRKREGPGALLLSRRPWQGLAAVGVGLEQPPAARAAPWPAGTHWRAPGAPSLSPSEQAEQHGVAEPPEREGGDTDCGHSLPGSWPLLAHWAGRGLFPPAASRAGNLERSAPRGSSGRLPWRRAEGLPHGLPPELPRACGCALRLNRHHLLLPAWPPLLLSPGPVFPLVRRASRAREWSGEEGSPHCLLPGLV